LGVATLERKASRPPFNAKTGMYHTQAVSTDGALVARYCLGRRKGKRIGRYAVPKTSSNTEKAICIERRE